MRVYQSHVHQCDSVYGETVYVAFALQTHALGKEQSLSPAVIGATLSQLCKAWNFQKGSGPTIGGQAFDSAPSCSSVLGKLGHLPLGS